MRTNDELIVAILSTAAYPLRPDFDELLEAIGRPVGQQVSPYFMSTLSFPLDAVPASAIEYEHVHIMEDFARARDRQDQGRNSGADHRCRTATVRRQRIDDFAVYSGLDLGGGLSLTPAYVGSSLSLVAT
jgi:hypothetical protein